MKSGKPSYTACSIFAEEKSFAVAKCENIVPKTHFFRKFYNKKSKLTKNCVYYFLKDNFEKN